MSETSPALKLTKKASKPKVTETPTDEPEAQAAPTPAAKVKTALKTKVKEQVAEAETEAVETEEKDSADLIISVAHKVENLTENRAFESIPRLLDNIEHDYFTLGGIAARVSSEGWYMNKGFESFKDFCEAELGMKYRKVMYLIAIYNGLVQSGVKWSQVGHLGWTKLKELASILTVDNVEDLVAQAEARTVLQLQEYIAGLNAAGSIDASNEGKESTDESTKTTTLTFKLHEDQKATVKEAIAKAKKALNTEFDAVAIEHICLDYIAGEAKATKKAPTLEAQMKGKTAEEVLEIFGKVFPDVNIEATVAS